MQKKYKPARSRSVPPWKKKHPTVENMSRWWKPRVVKNWYQNCCNRHPGNKQVIRGLIIFIIFCAIYYCTIITWLLIKCSLFIFVGIEKTITRIVLKTFFTPIMAFNRHHARTLLKFSVKIMQALIIMIILINYFFASKLKKYKYAST